MKNNTVVFKLNEKLHDKLMSFYKSFKCDKFPPYSKFQAKTYDVVITLYESGKVMFQGLGAENESAIWMGLEKKVSGTVITNEKKDKKEKNKDTLTNDNEIFINDSAIGSDETGCGDFFGPVVVCATYVSKENISLLKELGVKDSKKVDDEKIKEIAPILMQKIPYTCITLDNKTYNANFKNINMVKLKCILHNKALISLIEKYTPDYKYAVIDQFVNSKKYYSYLTDSPKVLKNVLFYTKGESKCMAIAAASIIARYVFLKEMKRLSEEVGINLQKGASNLVDNQIQEIIKKYDKNYLVNIGKLNFNNYRKIN